MVIDESKTKKQQKKIIGMLADEILSRQKFSFLIFRQFVIGIAYGLGASLGAAIIGGALIYIYRNILQGFIFRP